MRRSRRQQRRRRRTAVGAPLTSMGDIAFLLIIFFMLCSNFANEPGELDPPDAPDLKQLKQSPVSVAINADNEIYLNGTKVSGPDAVEWGVRSLIKGKKKRAERIVLFKCHREVKKSVYEPVLNAIASAGGLVAAVGQRRGKQ